jgi:RHH-type proline utilization regulon transcriptional repressor/proline dehydrogenase/delta 1-pyrroline-5-carboxylate dehydrogenase
MEEMSTVERRLQESTRDIGLELARLAAGRRPGLFDPRGLRGRLLGSAMRDTALRTQLFRFVDVLPQLDDDAAVAAHLRAYLGEFRLGGLWGRLLRCSGEPWCAFAVRRSVRRLAAQFLAEEMPRELARTLARLARRPALASLDAVGEAVLSEAEADAYRDRVLGLIQAQAHMVDGDVSLKLSALTPRFDPVDPEGSAERVWTRLGPIAEAARARGVALTVDMEHYALKPLIQEIFRQLALAYPQPGFRVGLALQAYLRDAAADLEHLLRFAEEHGRRIAVRLVKGAYWDTEQAWAAQRDWPVPVFLDKAETDAQYETLSRRLMAARTTVYAMIASHNLRSQAHASALARELGLPDSAWEAQMLYGMAEPLRDALIAAGVRVRIYVPTGDLITGIAYLIRRLLENTAGTSILRQAYVEGQSPQALLAPPLPKLAQAPQQPAGANAPLADYSQAGQRKAMAQALAQARGELGREFPRDGGGEWIVSTNPARTDEVIGRVQAARPEQVDVCVAAADVAGHAWRETPVHARADLLRAAARRLDARRALFAARIVLEAGKNWRDADADVAEAVDALVYYAGQMEALEGWHANRHDPGEVNDSCFEAMGPAAVIAPWNFPLAILAGMSAAALAAGCPVLLKPASLTPVIAWHYRELLLQAGIPADAVQWLPGAGGAVGQRLVIHPDVAAIAFTGSRAVGLGILEAAHARMPEQRRVKRVVCEMGGKNAVIVDADADLDEAVGEILASAFGYQGQKCSAASRVIAVGRVHDRLVERLVGALDSYEVGPPEEPRFLLGPLIDTAALDKALGYLAVGAREGRLAYGGRPPDEDHHRGHYFAPAIFTDIRPEHRLAREEIFAPVLAVLHAPDFATALDMALDSDYALTGGVFSRLPEHLELARARYRVGNLYLNRRITGAKVGAQPFGGVALSGSGIQAGGPEYLKQFLWSRTVSENTLRHGFVP